MPNKLKFSSAFLFYSLTIALSNPAFADCPAESVHSKMVGDWLLTKSGESLTIREDGSVHHSKFGDGDLRHIAGNRYELTYYAGQPGRPAMRSCTLIMTLMGPERMNNLESGKGQNCDFGVAERIVGAEKPSEKNKAAAPVVR